MLMDNVVHTVHKAVDETFCRFGEKTLVLCVEIYLPK